MTSCFPSVPFTRADVVSRGVSVGQLGRAVDAGQVRRVVRGVFVAAAVPDSVEVRAKAVSLVVSDGQIVIDRTAAWLHGVETLTLSETERLPAVEIAARRGARATDRGDVVGRTRDLAEHDIMTIRGVRVTTPLRTAMDLGCNLRRREALASLNSFAQLHDITPEQVYADIKRFRGRRGVVQLNDIAALIDPRIESPRESWTLMAIADAGLPLPQAQVWVDVAGVPTYRLDFGWREQRVAVEYDGVAVHLMTTEQRQHDQERRRTLRELGWTVVVVHNGDFSGPGLDRWLGEVRAALARRGYSPLRWLPRR